MHTNQGIVAVSSIENNRSNEKTRKFSIAVFAYPGDRTLSEKPIELMEMPGQVVSQVAAKAAKGGKKRKKE